MKKILLPILLFVSALCEGQTRMFPNGWRYTAPRQNLELSFTTEQSDAVTNFVIDPPPPTNVYFQAIEKQTGYTAIERQNSIVRAGSWAAKFNVNSSFPLDDRLRTETVYFSDINSLATRRYALSVYIPVGFNTAGSDWIEFVQWHAVDDGGDPPKISCVGIYITPGGSPHYDLNIAYQNPAYPPGLPWIDAHHDLGAISGDIGFWVDWVFFMKWDWRENGSGGSGVTTVWKDGVQVYTENGPNCYDDANGPYYKVGLHTPNTGNTNSIYIDEVRVGNASSTYYDVAPGNYAYMRAPKIIEMARNDNKKSKNVIFEWRNYEYLPGRKNLSKYYI